MFYSINSLININTNQVILLETIFSRNINDLQVGDIIFWKRNKTNGYYGHVGIVVDSTKTTVIIAQQNMDNLVEKYNKNGLIRAMNSKNTIFLGIKHLPRFIEFQNKIVVKKN
jgi:Cdc6-like AAA superfamily ATPase